MESKEKTIVERLMIQQETAKQKKMAKIEEFANDPTLRDYEYMLALYRDKIKDDPTMPRACYFSKRQLLDFMANIPDNGGIRMYHAIHFYDESYTYNDEIQLTHRSSTTLPQYEGRPTIVLCKVDADGDDILELIDEDDDDRLWALNLSPSDGGSLCPPNNFTGAHLLKNADRHFKPVVVLAETP